MISPRIVKGSLTPGEGRTSCLKALPATLCLGELKFVLDELTFAETFKDDEPGLN